MLAKKKIKSPAVKKLKPLASSFEQWDISVVTVVHFAV